MTAQQQTKPEIALPWRKLIDRNSKVFTSDDMPDDPRDPARKIDLTVKIERVQQHGIIEGNFGGKTEKSRAPLLFFAGIEKPFGVKSTVAGQITTVLGTNKPLHWQGQYITLCVVEEKIKGALTDCVRIRPIKPTEADWQRSQKGYKAPPFDLDQALASFTAARNLDELAGIKANMRSVPKAHHAALLTAYEARTKALTELAAQAAMDAHEDDDGEPLA